MLNGVRLAGYPVIDVKVDIVDGSFHEVDSNELAFKMAGNFRAEGRASRKPSRSCSSRS